MKLFEMKDMKGGWFVGDFEPTAFRTNEFEVCYKVHKKGEVWPKHYHKVATETNYLIRGRMVTGGKELVAGQIFVMEPGEVADPEFLADCELIVVKAPCVIGDKYEVI